MTWAKLSIVLLLLILPEFALTSLVAPPGMNTFSHAGFLPPSDATLMSRDDDVFNSPDDIPSKCKSACPDSFLTDVTSCTAKTNRKVKQCQCTKGPALLDQWTKCDDCMKVEWVAPGETYISNKPKCKNAKGPKCKGSLHHC